MFCCHSEKGYKFAVEKIEMKTLVHGEKSMLTEFRLQQGANLPAHSHPHEQTGYLISGHLLLTIGEETFTVKPGDSWCIPGMVEHKAQVLADSLAIEVFAPRREDYLP